MDLREIVAEGLKAKGFDGLYDSDAECGCLIENLMSCDEPNVHCEAGYKRPCDGKGENCDGDCDFHIGPDKAEHIPEAGKMVDSEGRANAEA